MLTPSGTSSTLTYNPCITSRGPTPAKILILGEAPGATEERQGIPFVGASGLELERMLQEAGLNPAEIFMTNVFQTRPPQNRLASLMMSSGEYKTLAKPAPTSSFAGAPSSSAPGSIATTPWAVSGATPIQVEGKKSYLNPEFLPELRRLHEEIDRCNPNLIIALGNTALWSLTGRGNISSLRGTTLASSMLSVERKILPTYHPAAVLRQWDLRSIVVADLMKAKAQAEFPHINRPTRIIEVNPTLRDIEHFLSSLDSASLLAADIETRNGQITEIGFAPSKDSALVVPFIRGYKDHYWSTLTEEVSALSLCKAILQHPIAKIFQNGLYDIQYIWRTWHFAPRNCLHDTMLRHHALYPEAQKGLGFLGSLYTDEPAWKMMRNKKDTQEKRDDE